MIGFEEGFHCSLTKLLTMTLLSPMAKKPLAGAGFEATPRVGLVGFWTPPTGAAGAGRPPVGRRCERRRPAELRWAETISSRGLSSLADMTKCVNDEMCD